jgi:hypothetical protein
LNRIVLHFSGVAALVLCAAVAALPAQTPRPQNPPAAAQQQGGEHHWNMPAPTNLQVLPKNLTAEQVHDIMHKWAGALGANCSTCHAVDPNRTGPNGRPVLNFADDSKPEKRTARLMYKMTENINENYVSMVENSGQPVTCGTCHRGHVTPEPFIPPPDHDHDHDHHEGPAPASQPK